MTRVQGITHLLTPHSGLCLVRPVLCCSSLSGETWTRAGPAVDQTAEWTLIVSIGNTIPFELGTSEASPDVTVELASGEGLLFNGWVVCAGVDKSSET